MELTMSISINSVMQQHVASNIAKADGLKRESQKDLVSGVRIYAAAKDPRGVALSQKFRARIQSLRESSANIGQAQDMIQVASGATDSVGGSLQRLRDLAVRAATGTISSSERAALQQEAIQIQESIDQVASNTEFGGLELTDGSVASVDVQAGDMQGDTIAVGLGDLTASGLGVDAGSLSLATQAGAEAAIGTIDQALDQVHSQAGALGTAYNRLGSSFGGVQTEIENMLTTEARIGDVDMAEATALMARNQVLSNAGLAVMVQANTDSRTAARLLS
jgi:flagellin